MLQQTLIRNMRHKLVFCTARDTADGGVLYQARDIVFTTMGGIETKKTSMFSKSGMAILEEKNRPTHNVYIRNNPMFNLSSAAWVYEEFRKSSPRWYKLIGVAELTDDMKFLKIQVNLAERGDDLRKPVDENSMLQPSQRKVPGL